MISCTTRTYMNAHMNVMVTSAREKSSLMPGDWKGT